MSGHHADVSLRPVLELPPFPWATVISPLASRIGCCGAKVQLAPALRLWRILPLLTFLVPRLRRKDHVVLVQVDGFFGTQPRVVHHRQEGDEPWPAWLLGAPRVQQCPRLARIHHASPVNLAGYLRRGPLEYPDRIRLEVAELDRVVHGVSQDRAVPPSGARGVLAVQPPGGLIQHPAGSRSLGECGQGSSVAGNPGENLGHLGRWGRALLGVESPPHQRPANARIIRPSAGFWQHHRRRRCQLLPVIRYEHDGVIPGEHAESGIPGA